MLILCVFPPIWMGGTCLALPPHYGGENIPPHSGGELRIIAPPYFWGGHKKFPPQGPEKWGGVFPPRVLKSGGAKTVPPHLWGEKGIYALRHTSTARETAQITVDHFMTSIPPKNSLIVRFFGIVLRTLSTRAFFRKFSDRSSRRTPLPGPRHPEHKKCSSEALKKFAKTPTDSYRKIFHSFCYPDCSNRKKS